MTQDSILGLDLVHKDAVETPKVLQLPLVSTTGCIPVILLLRLRDREEADDAVVTAHHGGEQGRVKHKII